MAKKPTYEELEQKPNESENIAIERKRVEEELHRQKNMVESIMGAMSLGVTVQDLDYNLIYQNNMLVDVFGNRVGEKCYRAFQGIDEVCDGCPVELAYKDGKPHTSIRRVEIPSGEITFWENVANPTRDASGKVVSCLEIKRNVTDRKQVEEALEKAHAELEQRVEERTAELRKANEQLKREVGERKRSEEAIQQSENKYRTLLEHLPQKIFLKDKDSVYLSCNENFAQDLKIKPEQIKGKTDYEFFPKEFAEKYRADDKKIVATGNTENIQEGYVNEDGQELLVETVKTPVKDEEGNIWGILGIFWDITERKKMEKEKRNLELQLLQSEKMASVGQLAAGVAHEINNPTGFVSSNLHALKDYQDDTGRLLKLYKKLIADLRDTIAKENLPSSIAQQVEQIAALEAEIDVDFILDDIPNLIGDCEEGTERIKKIVLDLKDFAHPGEDKLKFADINKGLNSTLNIVWNELKYKAKVTKDYGDLPQVRCYSQQLNQVFMNLLVNAGQAIEKEGEIKIVTRTVYGHAEIKISDTGVGIPEENLSKIFDPFFTSKEVGKGTGLGLNVAYNIIKKHNGTIDVLSTVGKGTTFTIRIPVVQGEED